jgi:hypothetical protein
VSGGRLRLVIKHENQILKVAAKEKVVIHLSGKAGVSARVAAIKPETGNLLEQERYALRDAISPDTLRRQGWGVVV